MQRLVICHVSRSVARPLESRLRELNVRFFRSESTRERIPLGTESRPPYARGKSDEEDRTRYEVLIEEDRLESVVEEIRLTCSGTIPGQAEGYLYVIDGRLGGEVLGTPFPKFAW